MEALHTAYTYTVDTPDVGGIFVTIREKLRVYEEIVTDKSGKKTLVTVVTDEVITDPKEVKLFQVSYNTRERMCDHMNSLTDDLIFNQWFKVKTHKPKKKKAEA